MLATCLHLQLIVCAGIEQGASAFQVQSLRGSGGGANSSPHCTSRVSCDPSLAKQIQLKELLAHRGARLLVPSSPLLPKLHDMRFVPSLMAPRISCHHHDHTHHPSRFFPPSQPTAACHSLSPLRCAHGHFMLQASVSLLLHEHASSASASPNPIACSSL